MGNSKNGIFEKFNSVLERTLVPIGAKMASQRHIRAIRDGMICATPLSIVGGIFLIIGSPPVDLERTLVPIGAKMASQRHIRAIRDGMICATPLSIVGGIFLIIGSPPVDLNRIEATNFFNKFLIAWKTFAMEHGAAIELPFNMTMSLMGLFIAIGIAYSLAKEYKLDTLGSLIISAVTFLIVSAPSQLAVFTEKLNDTMASTDILANKVMAMPATYLDAKGVFTAMIIGIVTVEITVFTEKLNDTMASTDILANKVMAMPATYLDAKGVFTAMIIGIVTVEITRILKKNKIEIRMPDSVPPAVSASFSAIIPLLINVVLFYGLSLFAQSATGKLIPQLIMDSLAPLVKAVSASFSAIIPLLINVVLFYGLSLFAQSATGKLIPQLIMDSLAPLVKAVDSVWGIILISIVTQLLWLVGLHGSSIVSGVIGAFEATNLAMNAEAVSAGAEALPYVYTTPFRAFFMIIGGAGATLALVLLMCRSKSAHLKAIGKLSLVPSLFNINEPVIFGAPLVLNPIMAIPFIGVQTVNGVIMYFAMKTGLIGKTFASVPWTTPAPLGGFLSTMDWKAGVAIILLLLLDMVLYFPFLRAYENQLNREELNAENDNLNLEDTVL